MSRPLQNFTRNFYLRSSSIIYRGNITLIAKKDKDPAKCSSYRNISLFNTDAKILVKVLINRIETALQEIISNDQPGFIKRRQSYFNVRRLLNVICTFNEDIPDCIVCVHAEKAFDCVAWAYFLSVLCTKTLRFRYYAYFRD